MQLTMKHSQRSLWAFFWGVSLAIFLANDLSASLMIKNSNIFIDECKKPTSKEIGTTVAAILEFAKTQDCDDAYNALKDSPELVLQGQGLVDISVISAFLELEFINLNNNAIEDVSPLASLPKVIHLLLNNNQIKDISSLASSTAPLSSLELNNNQISDFSALRNLTRLASLRISRNFATSLPLSKSHASLLAIEANNNFLEDLDSLAKVTTLRHLLARNNGIMSMAPLTRLANLTWVDLARNYIREVPEGLPQDLVYLDLSYNEIEEIAPIANHSSIEEIYLAGNRLRILPQFNMPKASVLDFSSNLLTDVTQLKTLDHGDVFKLTSNNNMIEYIDLGTLPSELTLLELANNKLTDLGFIRGMTNIAAAYLGANRIEDLSPLAALPNLARVDIHENRVRTLMPLKDMAALEYLRIAKNPLGTDIAKTPYNCPIEGSALPVIQWCKKIELENGNSRAQDLHD